MWSAFVNFQQAAHHRGHCHWLLLERGGCPYSITALSIKKPIPGKRKTQAYATDAAFCFLGVCPPVLLSFVVAFWELHVDLLCAKFKWWFPGLARLFFFLYFLRGLISWFLFISAQKRQLLGQAVPLLPLGNMPGQLEGIFGESVSRLWSTKRKSGKVTARILGLNHNGLWNDFSGRMRSV